MGCETLTHEIIARVGKNMCDNHLETFKDRHHRLEAVYRKTALFQELVVCF